MLNQVFGTIITIALMFIGLSVIAKVGIIALIVIGLILFILSKLSKTSAERYSIRNGRLIFRQNKSYEIQSFEEFQSDVEFLLRTLKYYIEYERQSNLSSSLPVLLKDIVNNSTLKYSEKPNKYGCIRNFECKGVHTMDAVEYWDHISKYLGKNQELYRKEIAVGGIKHLEFVVNHLKRGYDLTTLTR
jgi:hypothetical protein